jgi:hypothetical protein
VDFHCCLIHLFFLLFWVLFLLFLGLFLYDLLNLVRDFKDLCLLLLRMQQQLYFPLGL